VQPAGGADSRTSALAVHVGLALLTLVAYARLHANAFLSFDDVDYITQNPRVLAGISGSGIAWAFQSLRGANWHPLTLISHMLDCELFGVNPVGHHAVGLAWHLASTLLLFHLLRRMTGKVGPSAFVAAVFALHPLHVESVAWAAERKDVLSTFFWIAATLAYVRWTERPCAARYAVLLALYALGLLSKPMLVTLPFTLLLLDAWPLGRLSALWPRVREKLPLFLLAAASSVVTFLVQRAEGAMILGERTSLGSRIANALVSYAAYLWKSILPVDLAVHYPYPVGGHPAWKVAGAALLLLVLTAIAIRQARARPWLAVGWFWYLGTLVPVIGIVQVGEQSMADRYTYVPMIGLSVAVAFGVEELARRSKAARGIATGLFAACVLAWTACTFVQVGYWKDDKTLFTHTVRIEPGDHMAHGVLGLVAYKEERFDDAIAEYREALRLNPGYAQWSNNMGMALTRSGRVEEGRVQFEAALASDPHHSDAHHNLGYYYATQRKFDQAIPHFEESLEHQPDQPQVLFNLGLARMFKGQNDEAIAAFERALALQPDFAQARARLEAARAQRPRR